MRFFFAVAAVFCSFAVAQPGTSCCDPATASCQMAVRYCLNNTAGGSGGASGTNCQALACKTTSHSPSYSPSWNPRQPPAPSATATAATGSVLPTRQGRPTVSPNPSGGPTRSADPSYSGKPSGTETPSVSGFGSGTGTATASASATTTATATAAPQTMRPSATGTVRMSASPSATGMGSSMLTYSLSFPNSDPAAAVRPDRLGYLVNAIACSAKVPIELVFISYVRANGALVPFVEPPKNSTGVPTNCATIKSPSLRGRRQLQLVATPSMLVSIHYLSPAPATSTDPVFQSYSASIQGSTGGSTPIYAQPPLGNVSGAPAAVYPDKLNLSAGGIVGIALGLTAATLLAAGAYSIYLNRRKRPISRSSIVVTETRWSSLPKKATFSPETRRH